MNGCLWPSTFGMCRSLLTLNLERQGLYVESPEPWGLSRHLALFPGVWHSV